VTQASVGESVAAGEAPYLTTLIDGSGRGTVAGLVKARLRNVVQSSGPNAANLNGLLEEALKFLLGEFGGGFSFNWEKALPDLINIINSLLNEQKSSGGGGGSGTLAPGTYQIQGTITIGSGGGNGNITPPQPQPTPVPPPPSPNAASDPADRDLHPSRSPFGTP
jgi:hypothetical protein